MKQSDEIVEAVEVRAFKRREVPIQRSNVDPEQRWKNHHRNGKENRREQKQRSLTAFPPDCDLTDTECDGPEQIGVEDRTPIGVASGSCSDRVQNLDEEHEQESRRGKDNKRSSSVLPADKDAVRRELVVPVVRHR